jgi:hypothetical protein
MSYGNFKDYLVPDFDLLHEGRSLLQSLKSNINVILSWVKGHYSGSDRLLPNILNDAAHDLANKFLKKKQATIPLIEQSLNPPLQRFRCCMINQQ